MDPVTIGMFGMSAANMIGGWQAGKKAEKELKKMRKAMEKRVELARERFQHYTDTYGDAEKMMVADAMEGVNPDLQQVSSEARADVTGAFDRQQGEQRRQLQAMGLDPSSGRYQSSDRRMDMEQASQEALNVNRSRREEDARAEQETRRMRQQVGQFGAEMMHRGAQDVQQGMQSMANLSGQNASMYNDMASNMFSNASSMAMFGLDQTGGFGNQAGGSGSNVVQNSAGNAPTTDNFMSGVDAGGGFNATDFNVPAGGRQNGAGPSFQSDFATGGYSPGQGLDLDNYRYNMRG